MSWEFTPGFREYWLGADEDSDLLILSLLIKRGFTRYDYGMTIERTVEIPASRRLIIDVPPEAPTGRVILAFIPEQDGDFAKKRRNDEVTRELNRYYDGHSGESDSGVRGAAYRLFAQEDW